MYCPHSCYIAFNRNLFFAAIYLCSFLDLVFLNLLLSHSFPLHFFSSSLHFICTMYYHNFCYTAVYHYRILSALHFIFFMFYHPYAACYRYHISYVLPLIFSPCFITICVFYLHQEKRRMTSSTCAEVDGVCSQFSCTVKELKELMALRGHEAYNKIQQDYNGALEICRRLQTSPTEGGFQE